MPRIPHADDNGNERTGCVHAQALRVALHAFRGRTPARSSNAYPLKHGGTSRPTSAIHGKIRWFLSQHWRMACDLERGFEQGVPPDGPLHERAARHRARARSRRSGKTWSCPDE